MRLWTSPSCLVWFVAVNTTLVVGCGGSSSETPEPARPESWQLKVRHQRQLSSAQENEQSRELNRREQLDDPTPARSTWGMRGPSKPVSTMVLPPVPRDVPLPSTEKPEATAPEQTMPKTPTKKKSAMQPAKQN